MVISKIFLIANVICAVGTLLNTIDVIRNREILKGYSLIGSFLTFLACSLFQIAFGLSGLWDSVILGMITVIYWLIVTLYLVRNR